MKAPKRIYIVGHPGAGKALLAKALAEKLSWEFIDADIGLEYRIGKLGTEILGTDGMNHFSECQHKILENISKLNNTIIATDVSVVCDEKKS